MIWLAIFTPTNGRGYGSRLSGRSARLPGMTASPLYSPGTVDPVSIRDAVATTRRAARLWRAWTLETDRSAASIRKRLATHPTRLKR